MLTVTDRPPPYDPVKPGGQPRGGEDGEPQALPRRPPRRLPKALQARRRHAGGRRREGRGRLLPRGAGSCDQARCHGSSARAATAADFAIGQLVNQAVASTEIVDILAACGLDRPDIAVLSESSSPSFSKWSRRTSQWRPPRRTSTARWSPPPPQLSRRARGSPRPRRTPIPPTTTAASMPSQVIQELIALAKSLREQPDDGLTPEEAGFLRSAGEERERGRGYGQRAQLQVIAAELVKTIRERCVRRLVAPRQRPRGHAPRRAPPASQVRLPAGPPGRCGKARHPAGGSAGAGNITGCVAGGTAYLLRAATTKSRVPGPWVRCGILLAPGIFRQLRPRRGSKRCVVVSMS